jgi:hypothetical protein
MNDPHAATDAAFSDRRRPARSSRCCRRAPGGSASDCPRRGGNGLAARRRSGERHHVDLRIAHQGLADVGAARQNAEQAVGQTRFFEDPASVTPPDTDVRGSGFKITALPSASAGATARMDRISGKLNGEMTTTPTGTRRDMLRIGSRVRSSSP